MTLTVLSKVDGFLHVAGNRPKFSAVDAGEDVDRRPNVEPIHHGRGLAPRILATLAGI
jgi:hypothetical protein